MSRPTAAVTMRRIRAWVRRMCRVLSGAQDWLIAFDPQYPGYAQYHAAYAQAITSAAAVVGTANGVTAP